MIWLPDAIIHFQPAMTAKHLINFSMGEVQLRLTRCGAVLGIDVQSTRPFWFRRKCC
jgi:hypothetical protein